MVASIAERDGLVTMQQRVHLRHVGDIACRADDRVHQARRGMHTNVGVHSKVPVIALLRLLHFRSALAIFVLSRRRLLQSITLRRWFLHTLLNPSRPDDH